MKHIYVFLFLAVSLTLTSAVTLTGCRHEANELAHNHSHDHHEDEHAVEWDGEHHHSPTHIIIEPEQAGKLGIAVTTVSAGGFQETLQVDGSIEYAPSGQAVASSRSAGILTFSKSVTLGAHVNAGQVLATVSGAAMSGGDATEAARIQMDAAKRELDRLTPLHAEGIVSTRDYNAALQAYEVAKAAVGSTKSSSGSAVIAPISGIITSFSVSEGQAIGSGEAVATIASSDNIVLRANLPIRYAGNADSFTDADFQINGIPNIISVSAVGGKRISSATNIAQAGYIPLYFSLNASRLTPGSFCDVYLKSGKVSDAISVPKSAISEQQGQMFVYLRVEEDAYEKRPVTVGRGSACTVEITNGLHEGDQVVTGGLTFVRLAESSGTRPEGHSHNH